MRKPKPATKLGGKTFTATIDAFTRKSQERMEAVMIASAQDAAEMMTRPVKKGGRMRVYTGYLRASLRATFNRPAPVNPKGRPKKDAKPNSYKLSDSYVLTIAGWDFAKPLYLCFTASYARPREDRDAFVGATAQAWPQIVKRNVAKARKAFP